MDQCVSPVKVKNKEKSQGGGMLRNILPLFYVKKGHNRKVMSNKFYTIPKSRTVFVWIGE